MYLAIVKNPIDPDCWSEYKTESFDNKEEALEFLTGERECCGELWEYELYRMMPIPIEIKTVLVPITEEREVFVETEREEIS